MSPSVIWLYLVAAVPLYIGAQMYAHRPIRTRCERRACRGLNRLGIAEVYEFSIAGSDG